MYEIAEYIHANTYGTGVLLEQLVEHWPARLIGASSMSIYGEGLYRTPDGRFASPAERSFAQLKAGDWGCALPKVSRSTRCRHLRQSLRASPPSTLFPGSIRNECVS
jgi:hypothetical protein